MLIEYKLGSLEAKLGAKIASVTSGHNVTCFDYGDDITSIQVAKFTMPLHYDSYSKIICQRIVTARRNINPQ
ncbi:hypothetical protein BN440_4104 [Erwinia amylovora MR1]|nr:hypothetical protein BN440_4104 [Erwinia amylovora MR1]